MPSRPDLPCADCGGLMWSSTTNLPVGKARCRPCRKARPVHASPPPRKKKPPREWNCVVCGAHVVTTSAHGHNGKKCREHYRWKPLPCSTCGKQVYVKQHQRITFCSSACGTLEPICTPEPPSPHSKLRWRQCQCGRWICRPGPRKWCTAECRQAHNGKRGKCADCGTPLADNRRTYCLVCGAERKRSTDAACRRKYRQKYGRSFRARARHHGVDYEPVDRLVVYRRDGWRCGICQRKVDRGLKAPHPMMASLDHVVPMSRGGPHTYANVQCAHHLCNSLKSDREAGDQLALVD